MFFMNNVLDERVTSCCVTMMDIRYSCEMWTSCFSCRILMTSFAHTVRVSTPQLPLLAWLRPSVFPNRMSARPECRHTLREVPSTVVLTSATRYAPQPLMLFPAADLGAKRQHLPYGIPRVLQPSARHCILYHPDYINGFSRDTFMPLWVAYTIKPLVSHFHNL